MNRITTDVDIDVPDRDKLLAGLRHIGSSISRDNEMVKHNTGVYFQPIPFDPRTNLATIDHKEAEQLGYFKLDFLNNSVYEGIKDEAHLDRLMAAEVQWELFEKEEVTSLLVHIHSYHYLLKRLKPKSLEDLAMVLAIIRPGKAYLQDKSWEVIRDKVWQKENDGEYFFKRAHAIAYSMTIIVQLNLILEQLSGVAE